MEFKSKTPGFIAERLNHCVLVSLPKSKVFKKLVLEIRAKQQYTDFVQEYKIFLKIHENNVSFKDFFNM